MSTPPPVDIGLVDPNFKVLLAQAFPQIPAPFVDPETGVINQIWLQLLIALWQRTGAAPGGSVIDAEIFAVSDTNDSGSADALNVGSLSALIQDQVAVEIQRLGLDVPSPPQRDPLEALLFIDASGSGSSDDECGCCVEVVDLPEGGEISLSSYSCGTVFTNG